MEKTVALDEAIGHPDLASDMATLTQFRAQLSGNAPPPRQEDALTLDQFLDLTPEDRAAVQARLPRL